MASFDSGTSLASSKDRLSKGIQYILPSETLRSRLAHGMMWSVAGTLISRGLMLLSSIAVARLLGQQAVGEINMIQSTVGTWGALAGLGLGLAATRFTASLRAVDALRAGRTLSLIGLVALLSATLASLLLVFAAPHIATSSLNASYLVTPLMIGAATLFFSVIHGVQTGALAGFDDFRVLAKVNFLSGLVSFPCILLGAWLGHVPGMIAGLAVSLAIGCIWLQIALNGALHRFGIILQWRGCWAERQVLWHFTLPAALSNMLIAPAMWWGNTMLAKMPNGYAELGTLGVAQQWQTMLLFLPATLQPVLLSNLSNTNPHEREFWRMIRLAFVANSAVTGTAALIVSILAKPILGLYGDAFLVGWPTLCLLCFTTVLISTINVIGAIIASSMTMWWGFLLNLLWAIAFVTFSTFWVQYGHFGWASAFFCSYVCHLAWTSWFLLYKSKSPVSPYTS